MAKNKHKTAVNSGTTEQLNKAVAIQKSFTATNSLEEALRIGGACCDFSQPSMQSMNGYNNIMTSIISLQQYLLTYLYKTFGILGKIIDIPVDDAYKNNGFELNADSINENDLKELGDTLHKYQDIFN